jgi:hypothetical protein
VVVHVKSHRACPGPRPFERELFSRGTLAASFFLLWGYVANDKVLGSLFDRHRGRCYEDRLTFAELCGVLLDAVTRSKGSGRKALAHAGGRGQLSSKARAFYGKLARLPLPLAEAFLSHLTSLLRPLFPGGASRCGLPSCLGGLTVVVLDGKKIKEAAKRLLPARGLAGKLFGGKILAAYLPQDGLVVAMAAGPDGEANDIPLLPRALELARQAVAGSRLWVVDAQFCDLDQPERFCQGGDHLLARFSYRNSFTADPQRPARRGINQQGKGFTEEWGWMGVESDPRRVYLRRITLERPGEESVAVVTDLLDAGAYPASDLLQTYLARWQIENVFQQITEVFGLEQLIGSAPGATVFQASLCCVIHNMLQVIRGYIGEGREESLDEISSENIFESLNEELIGLHRFVGEALVALVLENQVGTAVQMRERLRSSLGGLWEERWKKATNKKRRKPQEKAKQSGAHTSVHKVLAKAKLERREQGSQLPSSCAQQ